MSLNEGWGLEDGPNWRGRAGAFRGVRGLLDDEAPLAAFPRANSTTNRPGRTALTKANLATPQTHRRMNDAMLQKPAVSDRDEGEALMFDWAAENPSWLSTTGDRRSVTALQPIRIY